MKNVKVIIGLMSLLKRGGDNMYLVTKKAYELDYSYGDSLEIIGLFTNEKLARKRVEQCQKYDDQKEDWYWFKYQITKISTDLPFGNEEQKGYPSSWHFE